MKTATECLVCEAETKDVWLCGQHAGRLVQMLERLPALAHELETTRARLDQMAKTVGGHSKGVAAPAIVNFDAADVLAAVRAMLTTWTHHIYRFNGTKPASFRIVDMAHCLRINTPQMVSTQPIGAMYEDVWDISRRATLAVDLPPDRAGYDYAGPCGAVFDNGVCPNQLWVKHGEHATTCQRCGTDWDVKNRRAGALAQAVNMTATADSISRALTAAGRQVTRAVIYQWSHRGKLVPAGVNKAGQALYRVGDVMDLLEGKQ